MAADSDIPAALKSVLSLAEDFPLSLKKWNQDRVIRTKASLQRAQFQELFLQARDTKEFKNLSAGNRLRCYALHALYNTDDYWLKRDAIAAMKEILTIGSEHITFELLEDPDLPIDIASRLKPKKVEFAEHYHGTYFVSSFPAEVYEQDDFLGRLAKAKLIVSGVYKPKEQVANAQDGIKTFLDTTNQRIWEYDADTQRLVAHRWTRNIMAFKLDPRTIKLLEEEDVKQPLWYLDAGHLYLIRYGNPYTQPGEQVVRNLYYSTLCQYVCEIAEQVDAGLVSNPPYHPEWALEYSHPMFGRHHRWGSRRPYIGRLINSLLSHYPDDRGEVQLGGRLAELPPDELARIAIPAYLAAMSRSEESDLHFRNREPVLSDAKTAFPYLTSYDSILTTELRWADLPCAKLQISSGWREVMSKLSAEDLIERLQAKAVQLSAALPGETFKILPNIQYILHFTSKVLNYTAQKERLSLDGLALLFMASYRMDARGKLVLRHGQPDPVCGAAWTAAKLAAQTVGYDLTSGAPISQNLLIALDKYVKKTIDVIWEPEARKKREDKIRKHKEKRKKRRQ